MKNLSLILISFLIISSQADAFYIWQDFDNPSFPPAGWTLYNTNTYNVNWEWSIRCSGYGSGFGACKANFNDYKSGVIFDIISPQYTNSVSGDSLIFDHAYATYGSSNDQLKIYYSTNNGVDWVLLITLNGGTSGELVTAPATGVPFVPTSTQWATKKYSLPVGTNKVKFSAVSAIGNNLFIDNVKIGTRYTTDVGVVGTTKYNKAIPQGATDTPKVIVRNFGTTAQSFSVVLKIPPGTYNETQNVTNLAPGAIQIINFPYYIATVPGIYNATAYTTLSSDQNKTNDTIYNNYYITTNPRNVLIEYCTGTWCQWCPCGKIAIMEFENYFPNTIVLAYHGSGSDPFINFNGNNILSLMGMTAYPTGTPDRTGNPSAYISSSGFFEYSFTRYIYKPVSPVKIEIINKTYNPSSRELNVTLNTTALENLTGQYKINYVITENNLIYTQTQNSYCPGGAGYVHKWVVRNMVNSATGENLNTGGVWNNGQVISKTFTTTINSAWVDNNCNLIIFVYKDASPLYGAEIQQTIQTQVTPTGINGINAGTPIKYELFQNYPNPFNPKTNIIFTVPKKGIVSLKIYDVTGKLISNYFEDYVKAGYYNVELDASNLSSGVYFYTLKADGFSDTKKFIVLK